MNDFDLIPAGLVRCDATGLILQLNTALLDWLGETSSDAYFGRPFHALLAPAGKIYFETHIRPMLMVEGAVREISLDLSGRNGMRTRVYLNGRVETGADGTPAALHFACFSGQQRHLYEQELLTKRRAAERYAALVEASPDAILNLDAALRLLGWNAAATGLFGHEEEAFAGQTIHGLLCPTVDAAELGNALSGLKAGTAIRTETAFQNAEGDTLPVEIHASDVRDEFEGFAGVVMVIRDIRERRRNEAKIQALNHEIIHRSTNQFAVIRAIARSTARHSKSEDFIHAFGERIDALARNLTLLGERSDGVTDLHALVESQLAHLGPDQHARVVIEGHPIDIDGQVSETLGLAIFELSTNAIKYGALSERASQTGRLSIDWRISEDHLELSWRESGVGPVVPPQEKGFGSQLTGPMLEQFTDGAVRIDYGPDGVSWTFGAPAERVLKA